MYNTSVKVGTHGQCPDVGIAYRSFNRITHAHVLVFPTIRTTLPPGVPLRRFYPYEGPFCYESRSHPCSRSRFKPNSVAITLSSALRRQPGLKITCCGSELSDCLQALRSAPADILLLGDGPSDHDCLIETLRNLHASHSRLGLILLLDSYDRNLVVNAMRSGVRGLFCRATQPFRALCRCIAVVYQGQFWANTEQMGYVIEALTSSPPTRVVNAKGEGLLSPREEQVVNLVAEGIGNRQVAQQLGIKENTVKKSLLRIYDKLGVSNRVELVLYALTHRGAETSAPKRPPLSVLAEDCVESIQVRAGGITLPVHSDN
jgi:DNA-binding NarL/FixJ family response regulator